jgi:hypothetical protein
MSGFGNRVVQMLMNQIIDKMQLHRLPFFQRWANRTVNSMKSVEDSAAAVAEMRRKAASDAKKSVSEAKGEFASEFKKEFFKGWK